jgi:hypothetical protein
MRTAIVTYGDGTVVTTRINGTEDSIKQYYAVGRHFNIGRVRDNVQPVTECRVLPLPPGPAMPSIEVYPDYSGI